MKEETRIAVIELHQLRETIREVIREEIGKQAVPLSQEVTYKETDRLSISQVAKYLGAITLTISGRTAPYQASWDDLPWSDMSRTAVVAGTYKVGIIDALGCNVQETITVDTTVVARISSAVNLACYGDRSGSITVSAVGGSLDYSYKLNNGGYQSYSVFSNLPAGN